MKIFGIAFRIHRSFWLLPLVLSAWTAHDEGLPNGIRMFILILLVFLCVLGHELSHSLVAMRLGIHVPVITLYPMGGVASMSRIPRDPNQEFLITIVGPLFNFILAAILFYPMWRWLGREDFLNPSLSSWPRMLANVFWVNPVLGFFNLIPAFPMDGGRILRSCLARFMSYARATRFSVFLGCFFAILFLLLGLWKHYWMLGMVGVYVFISASRELRVLKNDRTS